MEPVPGPALDFDQASYRAIFDSSENAILVLDWDQGTILEVNRKACESYGYTPEEMRGLRAHDMSGGDPAQVLEDSQRYVALAREGRCPRFEWRRRHRDGSLHWDEVYLKPATIGGRRVILTFGRDITHHKADVEELQRREEQYRRVFEASSDAMFLFDDQLRVVDVNPAALALYRTTREAMVGTVYVARVGGEDGEQRVAALHDALAGRTSHRESRALRYDGTWFEAEIRVMPFAQRRRPHALAVVRDIGERRARERELQRSEARLRATVEASFDAVIAMDQAGLVVEFNAAAERIFGWPREQAIGRKLSELLLPARHRAAHERGLAQFHATGGGPMIGRLVETTAVRADGTEIPVELAISVAAVAEGPIFVGHVRDISARHAAEQARGTLEAQLRQAQKMEAIGQLTGGIAHDFNNILTSVIGYVVMGQERAEHLKDAVLVRQLDQAQLAAQRARELIAQMLAFARRQKGDPRPLALTPLARRTLRLLRSTLPSSIALDAQWLDADEGGDESWVLADPVQLEQILFNLCINARDAMGGTGRITVRLGYRYSQRLTCASCRGAFEGGWVELRVGDTGHGIPRELLDRIFDPFFTTKPPGQGTGMGLAMVHGIVHDHGGHVLVDSTPGHGTTFSVLLPPTRPTQLPPPGLRPAGAAPIFPPMHVMVVEDDVAVGDYLREQLTNWGLAVTLLRHPVDALHMLDDPGCQPRVLLTDLTMPGLTGVQLADRVRELRPGLPVVMVTGDPGGWQESDLRDHGIAHLVRKPVEARELGAVLQQLLSPPH